MSLDDKVLNVNDDPATLAVLKQERPHLYYDRNRYIVRVTSGKTKDAMIAQQQGRLSWDWKVQD